MRKLTDTALNVAPNSTMADWERRLLLAVLWPILWLQGKMVRRVTPLLPEAVGPRRGTRGQGPPIRVLIAGDSAAAGVGVSTQDHALCGQLVNRLSTHHAVEWHVLAVKGLDSPGLTKLLAEAPSARFDVVVLSMGANDVTSLCPPRLWVQQQIALAELIDHRFSPDLLVYTAVPPMHACRALPQPLRWFMGRWALEMNARLSRWLSGHHKRTMHWHPETTTVNGLAIDGIHPNSLGYSCWAEELSARIRNMLSN